MSKLLDFLQSASNSVAGNVAGPVDLLSLLLGKAGVNVGDAPVGGTEWMRRQGLYRDVPQSAASIAGEAFGMLGPMLAVDKASDIARGLLRAGENLSAPTAAGQAAAQRGAIVWHASPYRFKKFDSSKIGTGEGAQAYGYGSYLAEHPKVAMTYQPRDPKFEQVLMRKYDAAERLQQYPAMQVYEDFLLHKTPSEVADSIAQAGFSPAELAQAQAAYKAASQQYFRQTAGFLYKVDLPDDAIARMLDWDKPLSQQAPGVRRFFEPYVAPVRESYAKPDVFDPKGRDLLELLRNRDAPGTGQAVPGTGIDANVSNILRANGIPGIRYLDGGSRGTGAGTSNFVVFPGEEALLKILERNGVPLGQ